MADETVDETKRPVICTRAEAKKVGAKTYFTGIPCKHGHTTKRWVSTAGCQQCVLAYNSSERGKEVLRAYWASPGYKAKDKSRDHRAYDRKRSATEHRKEYSRNLRHLRKYNLTADEREEMRRGQNNQCGICGVPFCPEAHRLDSMHVDHCHRTRLVRGLLCCQCNQGLGKFRDDPALLQAAIAYLENSQRRGEDLNGLPSS